MTAAITGISFFIVDPPSDSEHVVGEAPHLIAQRLGSPMSAGGRATMLGQNPTNLSGFNWQGAALIRCIDLGHRWSIPPPGLAKHSRRIGTCEPVTIDFADSAPQILNYNSAALLS